MRSFNPGLASYSGVRTDEETGHRVFRYTEPLYVTESCLECHGDPAGENCRWLPERGHEGRRHRWRHVHYRAYEHLRRRYCDICNAAGFHGAHYGCGCGSRHFPCGESFAAASHRVSRAAHDIEAEISTISLTRRRVLEEDELSEFTRDFDSMARHLERLCTDLNSEVKKQTEETACAQLTCLCTSSMNRKRHLINCMRNRPIKSEFSPSS